MPKDGQWQQYGKYLGLAFVLPSCTLVGFLIGKGLRFIQVLLGHKKLTTTEIYTQVWIRMLKAVHEASHPAKLEEGNRAARRPSLTLALRALAAAWGLRLGEEA